MRRRRSIFDSETERHVFREIESRWSSKLRVYPQLPLAKMLEIEPGDRLPPNEVRYFYDANVDYTFTSLADRPLFSVEFDGIGGGFSKDGAYVAVRDTEDPNRPWKMDFKLRVARRASYPLVVVSFDEIETLRGDESLTILDGIIGQFLAKQSFPRILQELIDDERERFAQPEGTGPRLSDEQDLVLQAELMSELDHDVLVRSGSELQGRLFLEFDCQYVFSQQWLTEPELPDVVSGIEEGRLVFTTDEAKWEALSRAWEAVERVGCRVVIKLPDGLPTVVQTTWVRNFAGAGVTPTHVATNIAEYLAFKNAVAIVSRARS